MDRRVFLVVVCNYVDVRMCVGRYGGRKCVDFLAVF